MITTPVLKKNSFSDKAFKQEEGIMITTPVLKKTSLSANASKTREDLLITTPVAQKPKFTDEAFKSEEGDSATTTTDTISTTTTTTTNTAEEEGALSWRYIGKAEDLKKIKCQRVYSKKGSKRDLGLFYNRRESTFHALGAWRGHMGKLNTCRLHPLAAWCGLWVS